MPRSGVHAMFPDAPRRGRLYESFYLRAVSPEQPTGVWIRYTVHKHEGQPARGSLWCTVFEGRDAPPFMHKLTTDELSAPAGGWIAVGDARLGSRHAEGSCGAASWSLRFSSPEPELRHLPHTLLYRTPLPRTKLTSPLPTARFEGTLELSPASPPASPLSPIAPLAGPPHPPPASRTIELDGWRGMVGHNWGAEHAERWIWLHGIGFSEQPQAWIDVAIGRVRVAGHTSPWVANGALQLDGERHRLGGLGARGLLVAERPERCVLSLPGAGGLVVEAHVQAPSAALAGWRYADPVRERRGGRRARRDPSRPRGHGSAHDVSNCSIAALTLVVRRPGQPARTLHTAHGAAYELGMREHDHGVPIAPFDDG